MAASDSKSLHSIGFLTAVHDPEQGWIGGYLLLNTAARPLEFHCTSPVRPNRAQEILYGPTLGEFLLGEVIGQTLIKKSEISPAWICTDLEDALAARGFVESPIAWLAAEDSLPRTKADNRAAQTIRFDSPHASPRPSRLLPLEIGGRRAAVAAGFAADGEEITARYGALPQPIDLCEPFERIREAITETQLRR